ncbi:hypothetical protein [Thiolapillus sp.]|uniref:hypothetical protein n=1 Tax=Thiolapillus sp. TaxID=2017437 RepID=UPI0025F8651B|nr:hypothetical protein [Thiolapillus sp.]
MTRTAGAQIGCQRLSRFWGLGCPKIYHEAEDTLDQCLHGHADLPGRGIHLHSLAYQYLAVLRGP